MASNIISAKEILINYLKRKNAEGLMNLKLECSCNKEDLMPCDWSSQNCIPLYVEDKTK